MLVADVTDGVVAGVGVGVVFLSSDDNGSFSGVRLLLQRMKPRPLRVTHALPIPMSLHFVECPPIPEYLYSVEYPPIPAPRCSGWMTLLDALPIAARVGCTNVGGGGVVVILTAIVLV
ncbi:hypothetical protein GGH99_004202, partial [Coemansia sp. RSA 1285]